ncbi:VOC family protein [Elioraea tepida]|jgi:catechol 2,3-dioxygenase-like lactoylglutathione lyase family enzyme|uniref:VOC family protein n=1 Tax=Elioraea tepida TaxID=2843330 RepID=A0A975U487_9PROT|nr:VOC family protein [Elioraea tepida]QXM25995.1 VOC family protein [Elioraea tepida]
MRLKGLDHMTINCAVGDLARVRDVYIAALGLAEGPRPDFPFPGHWLYLDGKPVVHLAGRASIAEGTMGPAKGSAGFDHVSFTAFGLEAARQRLADAGIPFEEAPVPGFPLHQIFLTDPLGQKIELTFSTEA